MDTAAYTILDRPPTPAKTTPFSQVSVTLNKQEYIQLLHDANYWKSQHKRAIARMEQLEIIHRLAIGDCNAREAVLRDELAIANAQIRELRKRAFGRKTEQQKQDDKMPGLKPAPAKSRGQQCGKPGHGRTLNAHLPAVLETIEIDTPLCPCCGLEFAQFPGTEDSEVLEIDVKAYRRKIRRKRYRKTCHCEDVPGIITAPPPPRLILKGKYGITIWVQLLLSKFLYGQPTHRLLQDLAHSGLTLSEGTLTGGLQTIAPLFEPVEAAFASKLRSEAHWHADETRWMVFAAIEGKIGHRWYMWVFQSKSAIHYVLDPSRSADVPIAELGAAAGGIISCDRYSAYKKFARLYPAFVLAFCWAHQRRDFLELANSYPELAAWALDWVDEIGGLYRLNDERLAVPRDTADFVERDLLLRQAVEKMTLARQAALQCSTLADPARKVMESMENHWSGLTVFVDHPEVPMDNNAGERSMRISVVGRKNFYGSGSRWSGELAATMYSLLMTVKLWDINPRTWLSAYLNACAKNGNQPPADLGPFLPWAMDARQMAAMKGVFAEPGHPDQEGIDSS
jgi:transposase